MKDFVRRYGWLCCLGLLLVTAAMLLAPGGMWITDNGNKYIQMRNLAGYGTLDLEHPVPELAPHGGFHFFEYNGGLRSFYPEYLAAATIPFYLLFGERGVVILPVAAALLLAWLAYRWGCSRLTAFALVAATPLGFYALTFWEMVPSALFALAMLVLLARSKPLAAGVVCAAGLLMREELYFAAAAAGMVMLLSKQWRELGRFAAGFLLAALPVWGYQYWSCGHFLGFHGANYYRNNRVGPFSLAGEAAGVLWNYYHHLLRFGSLRDPLELAAILVAPAALALGCIRRWRRRNAWQLGVAFAGGAVWSIAALRLFRQPCAAYAAAESVGLLSTLPLALGVWLNWRGLLLNSPRRVRSLMLFVLVYMLLVPPLMTRNDVGLVWGARHFLVILPPLLCLAWFAYRRMGWLRDARGIAALGVLAAASLLLQGFALRSLAVAGCESQALTRKIEGSGEEIVVSDLFYLPEQTPQLWFTRTMLEVTDRASAERLRVFLQKNGRESFLLVLSPIWRRIDNDALSALLAEYPPAAEPEKFDYPHGFMKQIIVRCRKRQER